MVVRRPRVFPRELAHIAERDREYVAAEMSAFLLSWLSGLTCPLVNPPTATCLCGPNWSQPQWVWTAARLGIPVRSVRVRVPALNQEWDVSNSVEKRIAMTVLDGQCFGTGDEVMAEQARKLAKAAGVRTLTAWFGGKEDSPAFMGADPLPDLSDETMLDALRLTLGRRS